MMRKIIILFMIAGLLTFAGCGNIKDYSGDLDDTLLMTEETNVDESSLDSMPVEEAGMEENIDEAADTAEENNADTSEDAGQPWPDVIPSDIPVLEDVQIDGHYPLSAGETHYQINLVVTEEDEQKLLDYIDKLADAGYVQESIADNNFGFNYFGANDKYSIFLNIVYDGLSKIGIDKK